MDECICAEMSTRDCQWYRYADAGCRKGRRCMRQENPRREAALGYVLSSGRQNSGTAIAKAQVKARGAVTRACGGKDKACGAGSDDVLLPAVGWMLEAWPSGASRGCAQPISDCADVSQCMSCLTDGATSEAHSAVYDAFVPTSPEAAGDKALRKCQIAIGKAVTTMIVARTDALRKCQESSGLQPGDFCPDSKVAAAITKAESKMRTAICKSCGRTDKLCGTGDEIAPAEIGFAAECLPVVVPGGRACAATVALLEDVISCIGCVATSRLRARHVSRPLRSIRIPRNALGREAPSLVPLNGFRACCQDVAFEEPDAAGDHTSGQLWLFAVVHTHEFCRWLLRRVAMKLAPDAIERFLDQQARFTNIVIVFVVTQCLEQC